MRYNDNALEKGAWCTAVNLCAEYQAYDTNTGNAFLPAVHFWCNAILGETKSAMHSGKGVCKHT